MVVEEECSDRQARWLCLATRQHTNALTKSRRRIIYSRVPESATNDWGGAMRRTNEGGGDGGGVGGDREWVIIRVKSKRAAWRRASSRKGKGSRRWT